MDWIAKAQKYWWLAVTLPTVFGAVGTAYVKWDQINTVIQFAFTEDADGYTGVEKFDTMWADYQYRMQGPETATSGGDR